MLKLSPVIGLALALSGCVSDRPRLANDLVGFGPQQIKIATDRAETPAHLSTVDFKELGDSKRFALISRLIRTTWDDVCDPANLQADGYSPGGWSQWVVHCKGSVIARDYIVAIPEHAKDNARVLKCHQAGPRNSTCSVIGPTETAATRTAAAL